MNQTYLAFDFGTKKIGVALGQSLTQSATPLPKISAQNGEADWSAIKKLIEEWRPSALIVGIPLNMDGTEQLITLAARKFSQQLQKHHNLPVHQVDERLTTVEARSRVFEAGGYKALKKSSIDSIAAQILLENWLRENSRPDLIDSL